MEKKVLLEKIEQIVYAIYTPDQVDIDRKFLEFLDEMERYMNTGLVEVELPDMNEWLMQVQIAYSIKDYVTLADVLCGIKEKLEVTK